jgi:hypothetical protein
MRLADHEAGSQDGLRCSEPNAGILADRARGGKADGCPDVCGVAVLIARDADTLPLACRLLQDSFMRRAVPRGAMISALHIGHVHGVPLYVHRSSCVTLALVTAVLAVRFFPARVPEAARPKLCLWALMSRAHALRLDPGA